MRTYRRAHLAAPSVPASFGFRSRTQLAKVRSDRLFAARRHLSMAANPHQPARLCCFLSPASSATRGHRSTGWHLFRKQNSRNNARRRSATLCARAKHRPLGMTTRLYTRTSRILPFGRMTKGNGAAVATRRAPIPRRSPPPRRPTPAPVLSVKSCFLATKSCLHRPTRPGLPADSGEETAREEQSLCAR